MNGACLSTRDALPTVATCCLTRNRDLIATGGLLLRALYYDVPGLLCRCDIEPVLTAIAPRALYSPNGEMYDMTPLSDVHTAARHARPAWEAEGASDRQRIEVEAGVGHIWTPVMSREVCAFLDQHLAG